MTGMSRQTGAALTGEAHIAQSIAEILTTPIGTRLMLRDYGSRLFELVDAPLNAATRLLFIAAIAGALRRWEPRLQLEKVALAVDGAGRVTASLTGRRTDVPANQRLQLSIPL